MFLPREEPEMRDLRIEETLGAAGGRVRKWADAVREDLEHTGFGDSIWLGHNMLQK